MLDAEMKRYGAAVSRLEKILLAHPTWTAHFTLALPRTLKDRKDSVAAKQQSEKKVPSTLFYEQHVIDALVARDHVQWYLSEMAADNAIELPRDTVATSSSSPQTANGDAAHLLLAPRLSQREFHRLARIDERLRSAVTVAINREHINLRQWRDTTEGRTGWWWMLDVERFATNTWKTLTLREIVYDLLAIFLVVASLLLMARTAIQIGVLVNRLYLFIGADQIGLDVITILTVLGQVVIGSPISITLAERITNALNNGIAAFPNSVLGIPLRWLRLPLTWWLAPVSTFFVGTLIFLSIALFIGTVAIPWFNSELDSAARLSQSTENRLDALRLINAVSQTDDYPRELVSLGLRSEEMGQLEQARRLYEEALAQESNFVFAAYRLASVYVDLDPNDPELQRLAIRTLDRALQDIAIYQASENSNAAPFDQDENRVRALHLTNEAQVYQMSFLLLTRRAEVFINRGEPQAALRDLNNALDLAERTKPELFITERPSVTSPDAQASDIDAQSDEMVNPATEATAVAVTEAEISIEAGQLRLPTTEMYYLLAVASTTLTDAEQNEDLAQLYRDFATEYWMKVVELADQTIGRQLMWQSEAEQQLQR